MGSTYTDLLGHLSFALTALSFFMRDIILLRILAVASILTGIVYNFRIPGGPLWLVIFWLVIFLAINSIRILIHVLENRGISFSDEEQELYRTIFRQFAPFEFLKLIRLGEWQTAAPGGFLATQGEDLDDLKLIYYGEVAIERDNREVARSRDGTLVGEMSYIHGGKATATVRVLGPTRYVSWPTEKLRKLLMRNPTMDLAMKTVLSEDLTRKLMEDPDAPGSGDG